MEQGTGPLGLLDLLKMRGFDVNQRFKLVRHQEARYDPHDFLRRGWIESYQAFQQRPVFNGLDCIISFIGVGGTLARLIGIYAVLARKPGREGFVPDGCPYDYWKKLDYFYEMERLPGFEELENRVVIEWGKAARSWQQRPSDKEVIEILPKGQLHRPFSDYLGFTLTGSVPTLTLSPDRTTQAPTAARPPVS